MTITIPVLKIGGSEMQTISLARALTDTLYSVVVCCYFDHDRRIVDSLRDAGAEVHLLERSRAEALPRLFSALFSYFRMQQPDIVHVQHLAPALVPILAARAAGIGAVCATVHQPGRTHGRRARALMKLASRFCDTIFCVSQAVERSWFGNALLYSPNQDARDRRHWTIYDALDIDRIRTVVAESGGDAVKLNLGLSRGPVLGCVGRLRWEKDQGTLLAALPSVLRVEPRLTLVMIGDGPDRAALEEQAEDLGISENIAWLGALAHEDVIRHYSLMDVVAVPSLFEGFGLTALEAMAAGKAVVATNVDGLRELVINGDSGVLVPPDNPDALASAILELLADTDSRTRMAARARERAALFSLARFRSCTVAAHDSLVRPLGIP